MPKKFPIWVLALIVILVALMNGAANYWHLYFHIWWLDIPMHIIGGFWIGLAALAIYFSGKHALPISGSWYSVLTVSLCATLIVGVGWEVFEWGVDWINGMVHLDIVDTLADIGNDLIGALIATVLFTRKGYNTHI